MEMEKGRETRNHCVLAALEKELSIRSHCASGELEKVLLIHSHYALAEPETVHETHSQVFEERVRRQYYRGRSSDSEKVLETMIDCPAFAAPRASQLQHLAESMIGRVFEMLWAWPL